MLASAYCFDSFWTLNSGYGLKNMMSFMFFTAATAVCWIQACHQWQTHVSYLPDPLWMNSLSDDLFISESFLACSAAPWVDVHLQHFFYYHQHFLYYYPWNEILVFSSPHVLHMSVYRNTCVHIWENNIRALHCYSMKLKKGFTASAALLFKRSGSFSCLLLVLWCCSFTNAHSKAASHFFVR